MKMHDLYSGLIRSDLRKGQNGENFWGRYNELDNTFIPDSSLLLHVQVNNLATLETYNENYDIANKFLFEAESLLSLAENNETQSLNQVYSRIINLMNSGIKESKINPYEHKNKKLTKDEQTKKIKSILEELENLLKAINTSEPLQAQMIATLQTKLENYNIKNNNDNYVKEKADEIEMLAMEQLNKKEGFRSIVTGSWTDSLGEQLIEDAFVFNENDNIQFKNGVLSYYIKKGNNSKKELRRTNSIKDFLTQLDELNGTNVSVSVSDELYNALQTAAEVAVQVKSGQRQPLLNKTVNRNTISLSKVDFQPILLWELFEKDMKDGTKYFKSENEQKSEDLKALANYSLSRNIAYTNIMKNQVYFTEEGLVSASQWMRINKKYLVFNPDVLSVSQNFLICNRPYSFKSVT